MNKLNVLQDNNTCHCGCSLKQRTYNNIVKNYGEDIANKLYHLSVLNSFYDDEFEMIHAYMDNGCNMDIYKQMIEEFGEVSPDYTHTISFTEWIWDNIDIDSIPDINIINKCSQLLYREDRTEDDINECMQLQNYLYERLYCHESIKEDIFCPDLLDIK